MYETCAVGFFAFPSSGPSTLRPFDRLRAGKLRRASGQAAALRRAVPELDEGQEPRYFLSSAFRVFALCERKYAKRYNHQVPLVKSIILSPQFGRIAPATHTQRVAGVGSHSIARVSLGNADIR